MDSTLQVSVIAKWKFMDKDSGGNTLGCFEIPLKTV